MEHKPEKHKINTPKNGNNNSHNKIVDIKFIAHDAFLEYFQYRYKDKCGELETNVITNKS
jgi:hypothetical protein